MEHGAAHVQVEEGSERVSVTFPKPHHAELQRIAYQKHVSLAWVVRDAVRQYLAAHTPLFRDQV